LCPRPISPIHPGIQDFMGGYDYIAVPAPLLSHNGEKGVVRKGCLKRVVLSQCVSMGLDVAQANFHNR
jgi:hypothetical protein